MKKAIVFISLIVFICIGTACASTGGYGKIQEMVGENTGLSSVAFHSLADVCEHSNTIVKATYVDCEQFDATLNIYHFRVVKDYTGLCDEGILSVYESAFSTFIEGKSYTLFLNGHRSALYPHVVYTRVCRELLIGEENNRYTFFNSFSLDAESIPDLSTYIENEIVAKQRYITNPERLLHEEPDDACENADGIVLATVTQVEVINPFVALAKYSIDTVFKQVDGYEIQSEGSARPVPADTEVGDKFLFLFRYSPDTHSYSMYRNENSFFSATSDIGLGIIEKFGMRK